MGLRNASGVGLLGLLLAMTLALACAREPIFVDDRAGLLRADEQARITRICRRLHTDLDIQILTVVLAGPVADIDAEAVEVFAQARLGAHTRGARGLLFLVDPAGARVRLEVGYDLEGIFTDAVVGRVERTQMAPFFAAGRVGPGIEATVELLVAQALGDKDFRADGGAEAPRSGEAHGSGGGGARADAPIGGGLAPKPASPLAGGFGARPSPRDTLAAYREALALRLKDPDLGIYTPESREFFRGWVVTDAQQAHEQQTLERHLDRGAYVEAGDRAVLRFPVADRGAGPYFFRRGEAGWMLDFASMSRLIGFNHLNQWHFRAADHPYMFAFEDLVFDAHGFPHPRPR